MAMSRAATNSPEHAAASRTGLSMTGHLLRFIVGLLGLEVGANQHTDCACDTEAASTGCKGSGAIVQQQFGAKLMCQRDHGALASVEVP